MRPCLQNNQTKKGLEVWLMLQVKCPEYYQKKKKGKWMYADSLPPSLLLVFSFPACQWRPVWVVPSALSSEMGTVRWLLIQMLGHFSRCSNFF
jgi:hypothetical protein